MGGNVLKLRWLETGRLLEARASEQPGESGATPKSPNGYAYRDRCRLYLEEEPDADPRSEPIRWPEFDCSQEPLPDEIRLRLWIIDGAERRHRLARRWLGEAQGPDLPLAHELDADICGYDVAVDVEAAAAGAQRKSTENC